MSYEQNEQFKDKEWLVEEYKERDKTGHRIAHEQNVSPQTVYNWLERHGIERRDGHRAQYGKKSWAKHPELQDEEWLRTQYVEEERSQVDIADELSVTSPCVKYWLDKHGIFDRREGPQNQLDTELQRDPKWHERRQFAIERDGNQCVDCGITDDEYERGFDVHHLRKKDCFVQGDGSVDWAAANHVNNLATLCRSCHLKRHTR